MGTNGLGTQAGIYKWKFWLLLLVIFVPTLFIPVLPLYKGATKIGTLPVWAMYPAIFVAPEFFVVACPVVLTHSIVSLTLARRFVNIAAEPFKISLLGMFTMTGVLALMLSVVLNMGPIGFSISFVAVLLTILLANMANQKKLLGLPIPNLNRVTFDIAVVLCLILVGQLAWHLSTFYYD